MLILAQMKPNTRHTIQLTVEFVLASTAASIIYSNANNRYNHQENTLRMYDIIVSYDPKLEALKIQQNHRQRNKPLARDTFSFVFSPWNTV